jgi:hypothetical protein
MSVKWMTNYEATAAPLLQDFDSLLSKSLL